MKNQAENMNNASFQEADLDEIQGLKTSFLKTAHS